MNNNVKAADCIVVILLALFLPIDLFKILKKGVMKL